MFTGDGFELESAASRRAPSRSAGATRHASTGTVTECRSYEAGLDGHRHGVPVLRGTLAVSAETRAAGSATTGTIVVVDIGDDDRFARSIARFNEREFEEAAELFEELFLEAVYGEIELARALLQFAAGAHHIERGQRKVAIERIEEGFRALAKVEDARGIDAEGLRASVAEFVRWIEEPGSTSPVPWPMIRRDAPSSRA